MTFTSFSFFLFFPIVILIYYLVPIKFKKAVLLVSSYYFYLNIQPVLALVLFFVTITSFFFAKLIHKNQEEEKKKRSMIIGIIILFLPLLFFKYFDVLRYSFSALLESINLNWSISGVELILPIGISFYTFMAVGYIIDVYNEEIDPETNFIVYSLFISFFPLILSGPIERAKNLLPQLNGVFSFDYDLCIKGIKLMLWGYFMKLVIADRTGIYVDAVYENVLSHNGKSLLLAALLYPFQVYCDLGGYSLITIGVSNILGIRVMNNFKRPFTATSMSEFWRRWHISLITWLTDYVFTPLSFTFRRFKVWGIVLALMLTFFISGIWHGAALTFVVWGLFQGLLLSFEALTSRSRSEFERKYSLNRKVWYLIACIISTFLLFACSQVFGRAKNIDEALLVFSKLFTEWGALFIGTPSTLIFIFIGIGILLLKDFTDEFAPTKYLLFENNNLVIRFLSYSTVIILILMIGVLDAGQFIYFKF